MSYRVQISSLDRELQLKIIKDLTIFEIQTFKNKNLSKKSLKVYDKENGYALLPYTYVISILKKSILNLTSENIKKIDINFLGVLRHKQIQPVNEALNYLENFGCVRLNARPGFGKTLISIYLACQIKEKTLIDHAFKALNEQWLKTVYNNTNNKNVAIVGINSSEEVEKADILICMVGRIEKIPKLSEFKFLIIDECHTWLTQIRINKLLTIHPRYIIAVSATFERPDGLHKAMEKIVGDKKVVIEYDEPIKVTKYETNIDTELVTNERGVDNTDLRKKLSNNDERNKMILEIVKSNPESKILILTWLGTHVETLEKLFKENNENIESFYGLKKTHSNSRTLVGTIQKIGTGYDQASSVQDFDGINIDTVILASSVKNVNLFIQIFGRAFRTDKIPHLIYLVDNDRISKGHWASCNRWIKERNSTVEILDGETFLNEKEIEELEIEELEINDKQ